MLYQGLGDQPLAHRRRDDEMFHDAFLNLVIEAADEAGAATTLYVAD
jgi:hypothetical protein